MDRKRERDDLMKQIKFRAWDSISKQLFIPDGILKDGRSFLITDQKSIMAYDLDKFPLMQYTGLKDKNGKEIYFDDIVKITWRKDTDSYLQQGDDYIEKEFIARIDWHIDRIVYVLANGKKLNCPSDAQFEVIGNIYENPELLEDKK